MSIKSSTANMIYADQKVANMMKGKVAKRHPDQEWEVAKVTTGWQVRQVQPEVPVVLEAPKPVEKVVVKAGPHTVTVVVPFAKETVRWIDFKEPVGPKGLKFFHKAHVVSSDLIDGMLHMVVVRKAAIEKGLIAE